MKGKQEVAPAQEKFWRNSVHASATTFLLVCLINFFPTKDFCFQSPGYPSYFQRNPINYDIQQHQRIIPRNSAELKLPPPPKERLLGTLWKPAVLFYILIFLMKWLKEKKRSEKVKAQKLTPGSIQTSPLLLLFFPLVKKARYIKMHVTSVLKIGTGLIKTTMQPDMDTQRSLKGWKDRGLEAGGTMNKLVFPRGQLSCRDKKEIMLHQNMFLKNLD